MDCYLRTSSLIVHYNEFLFIPASNEPSSRACTDTNDNRMNSIVMRLPRGVLSAGGACPARLEAERRPEYQCAKAHSSLLRIKLDTPSACCGVFDCQDAKMHIVFQEGKITRDLDILL